LTTVSVGLPVYNGERYLDTALRTLVEQTHADLDIIISDNASTDRTQEICESYAARDARIRYFRQPVNRGGAFNHTFVARQAKGPYFRWYSYDDWLGPECIAQCARVLDEDESVVLAWAQQTSVYEAELVVEYETEPPWDDGTSRSRVRSLLKPPTHESLLGYCYPIYALLASLPMGAFFGSDHVILVSWAMAGSWRRLPEGMFFCRRHDANSTSAKSIHEVATWMDPNTTPGRSMPFVRRFVGFLRAVGHADLTVSDRLRCGLVAMAWPFSDQRWRLLVWDLRVLLREVASQSTSPMATRERSLRPSV
jgi:glycosyltransferase involved in cell wall biosynthesis